MKGMGCPPSGARSGGHPTSRMRPSLNDEITSHLLQACHSPSCQCRLCPKAGGRPAPGPEGWGCKRYMILENTLWIRVIMKWQSDLYGSNICWEALGAYHSWNKMLMTKTTQPSFHKRTFVERGLYLDCQRPPCSLMPGHLIGVCVCLGERGAWMEDAEKSLMKKCVCILS